MDRSKPHDWKATRANSSGKARQGIHMVSTEAINLDEALDIIAAQQRLAATRKAITERTRPPTLKEELRNAKFRAMNLKQTGKISLANGEHSKRTLPSGRPRHGTKLHPLKDLPDDQKRAKAQEFFASGCWGMGTPAARRLARAFNTTLGQMTEWLDDN